MAKLVGVKHVPVANPVETVTLELTLAEAKVLAMIAYTTGGDPKGLRGLVDDIGGKLKEAIGFVPRAEYRDYILNKVSFPNSHRNLPAFSYGF